MKKLRTLALILVVAMCTSLLTGCMGVVMDAKINKDGSGTLTLYQGYSEAGFENMNQLSEKQYSIEDFEKFEYNGITYYGEIETLSFSSPAEFNKIAKGDESEIDSGDVDAGELELTKNSDGSLQLTLYVTQETGDTTEIESSGAEMDIDQEKINAMLEEMSVAYEIEFPENIYQTAGATEGVTINGKKLKLDMMKIGENITSSSALVFSTKKNGGTTTEQKPVEPTPTTPTTPETSKTKFVDVPKEFWGYKAINTIAEEGIILGMGDNKFIPNGQITYAQMCTILAREEGLETGTKNGYWAYKAIESCRNKGYIVDRGAYTSANYDVPMPREAAVSALFRAKATKLYTSGKVGDSIATWDVPDYWDIDPNYASDIVDAYNCGLTNGVDSSRRFNPKGAITRAEACQLLYNLKNILDDNILDTDIFGDNTIGQPDNNYETPKQDSGVLDTDIF